VAHRGETVERLCSVQGKTHLTESGERLRREKGSISVEIEILQKIPA